MRRLLATVPERRDRRESAGEEVSPQGPGTRYACTGTSSPPGGRGTPEPGRHGARAVGCASPSECKPWERLCCPGGRKVPRDATPIASGPRFSSMGFIPSAECQRARGRTSVRTWDKTRSIYVVLSSKRESVPRANRLSPRLVEGSRIKKERKSRQGQPWLNWVVRLRRRAYG